MKKLISVVLAVMLMAALCVTAFAATGINAHEQAVLDKLSTSKVIGANGWSFIIPPEYVNTAKNYFAGDCDMTEAQKNVIIACIEEGMVIVEKEANAVNFSGKLYTLRSMTPESRSKVLALGQKACAEVGLDLIYNGTTDKVIITPEGSTTPVFESTPLVKTTGEDFVMSTGLLLAIVAAAMVACTAGLFVISKKKGLLVK